jgi:hypothetical protein
MAQINGIKSCQGRNAMLYKLLKLHEAEHYQILIGNTRHLDDGWK